MTEGVWLLVVQDGGALTLSEATVKTHVARIFAKLALRDRAQAVVLAYETGLVVPEANAGEQPGPRSKRWPGALAQEPSGGLTITHTTLPSAFR